MSILYKKIQSIVSKQFNIKPQFITNTSLFIEELCADSLDIIELIMTLEEEFNIEISDEQSNNLKNLNDVIFLFFFFITHFLYNNSMFLLLLHK